MNISENKPVAHPIEVDGVKGFVEYYFGPCIANCEGAGANVMEKRIVFPFANHYSAVVYRFSGEYLKQDDKLIDNLYRGNYPESDKEGLELIDKLVSSLNFSAKQ
ncbi:MAG: hypothetical protein NT165_02990 [Candidatus Falkowbacteria bacterium]|nr:hypothetical protein [Candidatus Falkowbacteria bacterium]